MSTTDIIHKLIAFDTTSRESNLDLIHFIQEYLGDLGVASKLVHDDAKQKANLYATLGPLDRAGIMLSGHTDVVPVDGQDWDSNPFDIMEKDARLYGRGTCDMKSFIAIALAYAPKFLERGLQTPIHLAFSYDEEIGCIGVRRLIEVMNGMEIKPKLCIVGEPTNMRVIIAHKGKTSYRCTVRGFEAHSSLAPHGVNAIEFAAELIAHMKLMARRIAKDGPFDPLFDVPHTTLHTGIVEGGTALNIVPKECYFEFEIRYLPDQKAETYLDEIETFIRDELEPEMKSISNSAGFEISIKSAMPGLNMDPGDDAVNFVKALAGQNDHAKVAFGTEAGLFQQRAGVPTVVCGPGSVNQAHKPNEFIEKSQIVKCEAFMDRLVEQVCDAA
ncbi:acetylornithine deacetylase [Alphaproteobacteria bacterium]|nr:acetylornithine deacetylase [Alphaproteobacteria bacterium]